ncbi:SDR family NAD(P)-dependent oxidoreductase [Sulfitobacter sp. LCG007]
MFEGKTWWIVGASEGLGAALAQELDAAGARLVLSARSAEKLATLAGGLRDARAVAMDVTDPASVSRAVADAGDVDCLIYAAGQYEPMSAAEWQSEEVLRMVDVNLVGALRVLGEVVPQMVAKDRGRIAIVGSLAGFAGLPGVMGYGVSKAALMHLAENMLVDLKDTGVRVQRINPGYIRTRLTAKNDFRMPQIMEPRDAAREVVRALRSGRFSTSFPRPFAWLFQLGSLLPPRLFQRLLFGKGKR